MNEEKCSRLIRRLRVMQITGLSRSAIYDRLNSRSPRHDAQFPRPIKIGKSAVAWVEAEVISYVGELVRRSRGTTA